MRGGPAMRSLAEQRQRERDPMAINVEFTERLQQPLVRNHGATTLRTRAAS